MNFAEFPPTAKGLKLCSRDRRAPPGRRKSLSSDVAGTPTGFTQRFLDHSVRAGARSPGDMGGSRRGLWIWPLVAGPWTAWPQTGAPDIDPYARAALARRGEAPMARELGLSFVARTDSSGAPLDGRCDYLISSPTPPARFWTLGLFDLKARRSTNDTQRYAYTSAGDSEARGRRVSDRGGEERETG